MRENCVGLPYVPTLYRYVNSIYVICWKQLILCRRFVRLVFLKKLNEISYNAVQSVENQSTY
jgi:hypothetical protein